MWQNLKKAYASHEARINRFIQWTFIATMLGGKWGFYYMLWMALLTLIVVTAALAWQRIVSIYIEEATSTFSDRTVSSFHNPGL